MSMNTIMLASADWPLRVSGGPGKTIIVWTLIIIGVIAIIGIIEWDKTISLIDKITHNKWGLTLKNKGMSTIETRKTKTWAWVCIAVWALIIATAAMFIPQFGARQINYSNVIATYNITSITPTDIDKRLLTDNGFKLTPTRTASYPVKFLVEGQNVETNGAIVVNGNEAKLVALDSGPKPTVKTGTAKSLF